MSDTDSAVLSERVFERILVSFPVSESPYCDLGAELGASEIDVLSTALELRECGRVLAIAAVFADFEGFIASAPQDDADLALLVGTDLPTSEHPYAEIAAQMQLRGIDQTATWVMARLHAWLADGTVLRVTAQTA
jgi:hypothetical protein